jgi:hypothetical protein
LKPKRVLVGHFDKVKSQADDDGGIKRHGCEVPPGDLTPVAAYRCTEVIAVNAVVTDTAVDIGRTKASIGMAISAAPKSRRAASGERADHHQYEEGQSKQ